VAQKKQLRKATRQLVANYKNKIRTFSLKDFLKTDVDPFRFSFNVEAWGLKKAVRREIEHKLEMALEDLFGDFHEAYLGNARHLKSGTQWENIPKGKIPGIDIANRKKRVFLQLKSKHNSLNSSSAENLAKQIKDYASKDSRSTVGCGWVIAGSKRKCNGETKIAKVGVIYKGRELYEFVTSSKNEMDEVLRDFPAVARRAVKDVNFNDLLDEAAERVARALQQQAKSSGITITKYLYQKAVE
jgi:hypothetical protein